MEAFDWEQLWEEREDIYHIQDEKERKNRTERLDYDIYELGRRDELIWNFKEFPYEEGQLWLDFSKFEQEEVFIKQIDDPEERKRRRKLLYAARCSLLAYNGRQWQYKAEHRRRRLEERGVRFLPHSMPNAIKAQWNRLFASGISQKDKSCVHYHQFRWHIFSYECIPGVLEMDAARNAFDTCRKNKVFLFYQEKESAFLLENAHLLRAEDFEEENDIYLYDTEEKWTYVHTHEDMCGPYFYMQEK